MEINFTFCRVDPLKCVIQLRAFSICKQEYNPISDWNLTRKTKSTSIHLTQPEWDLCPLSAEKQHPVYIMI